MPSATWLLERARLEPATDLTGSVDDLWQGRRRSDSASVEGSKSRDRIGRALVGIEVLGLFPTDVSAVFGAGR